MFESEENKAFEVWILSTLLDELKSFQRNAVSALLIQRDAVVFIKTGEGKDLTLNNLPLRTIYVQVGGSHKSSTDQVKSCILIISAKKKKKPKKTNKKKNQPTKQTNTPPPKKKPPKNVATMIFCLEPVVDKGVH